MKRYAQIINGVVGQARLEPHEGSVLLPAYVQTDDTTPDNGVTFYRNGELLVPPPITWSALEFLSKFTNEQKIMLYRGAAGDDGLALLMMHLFTAQEVISNHPMTLAARAALLPILGEAETVRIFDQA